MAPDYRFRFQILDANTGEVVASDYCTITDAFIDAFGGCGVVDVHVAAMLRAWQRSGRAAHEQEAALS